jgi:hypothetical protein
MESKDWQTDWRVGLPNVFFVCRPDFFFRVDVHFIDVSILSNQQNTWDFFSQFAANFLSHFFAAKFSKDLFFCFEIFLRRRNSTGRPLI